MQPDVPDGPAMFSALLRNANRMEGAEILRRVGRHVLARRPLVAGLEQPDEDDQGYLSSEEQHPWVDFQLLDASPEQRLLDSSDFDKYDILLEAWPEGFDRVIFSFGDHDESYADDIVETVLQHANDRSIPIKADAGLTDEQFKDGLREEFVVFIHQWRARTLEMLT